jgi:sorbitol-specific phosphotransferase system component IIA
MSGAFNEKTVGLETRQHFNLPEVKSIYQRKLQHFGHVTWRISGESVPEFRLDMSAKSSATIVLFLTCFKL